MFSIKKQFRCIIVINRKVRCFLVTILDVGAVNYAEMPHSEQ